MSFPSLVKNINPNPSAGSNPRWMGVLNEYLYFTANDSTNGYELWKTNGTNAGTILVRNIGPGALNGTYYAGYQSDTLGGSLFFAGDGGTGFELWKSDGTAAGTVLVKEIASGTFTGYYGGTYQYLSFPTFFGASSSTQLFFRAFDPAQGSELWVSDGTAAGTVALDIGLGGSGAAWLTRMGAYVYFTATDGINGAELWKTNGTTAGTSLVKDINPSPYQPGYYDGTDPPSNFIVSDKKLFFAADDGVNGRELWISDGTEAGTSMVKDINTGGGSTPYGIIALGANVYFSANDGINGRELWKSDGTAAGTTLFTEIAAGGASGYYYSRLTVVGNKFFFVAETATNGGELWVSDGTAANTAMVKDINPNGNASSLPRNLTAFNNKLYFTADDGTNGVELWESNGTAVGTKLVSNIRTGAASSNPGNLKVVGNKLYFAADDGSSGEELWVLSANSAPTDIAASAASFNENIAVGTAVASLTTTDPDIGDTFAYSFELGAGSTDNTAFEIVGNQIKIKASPDYETKNSYSVRVRTTDLDGLFYEKALIFSVKDLPETPITKTYSGDYDFVITGTPASGRVVATQKVKVGKTTTTVTRIDETFTNVETVDITAGASINSIDAKGWTGKTIMKALAANDIMTAGTGITTFTGSTGADKYRFVVKPDLTKDLADHITDFNGTQGDKIEISRATFGIPKTTRVSVATISGPTALEIGLKTTALFVYDSSTGDLWWNQNGATATAGTGGVFAVLDNKPAVLAATSITLI